MEVEKFYYDNKVVRKFIVATMLWGIVGMSVGLLLAFMFLFPNLTEGISWLSFGRLRPLHTNAVIFAFVGNAIFAGVYYSSQRLLKARMWKDWLSNFNFWGWQAIIVGAAITLPLGYTTSKEYAELEWPIDIAIATALDALNQAFESIWNLNANLFTRSMARHAIVLGLECLPIINDINDDPSLRTKLCIASVSAGMAISQTRTSICHSISYPLTLKYGIDHGLACAFSMIAVYKFNLLSIASDINIIRNYIKEDPLIVIESIFKKHDLYARLAKSLPSKAKFSSEIEEFITTGRFENNIRKCSREDLVEILNTSYDCVMN